MSRQQQGVGAPRHAAAAAEEVGEEHADLRGEETHAAWGEGRAVQTGARHILGRHLARSREISGDLGRSREIS